jgi:cell division protein FtsB
VHLGHHFRERRRQRRLAMVNVTNRAHVYVRLIALKFLFGHGANPLKNMF